MRTSKALGGLPCLEAASARRVYSKETKREGWDLSPAMHQR